MEWYESVKPYVAVGILGPVIALLYILTVGDEPLSVIYPAVVLFVCFPIIMMGAFFWITGRGKNAINGIDWSRYTEEEAKRTVSYTGFWVMITVIILIYGLSFIFISIWAAVSVIAVAIVLMVVTLLRPFFKKIDRPLPSMDSVKALSVFILITAVSLVPTAYLMTGSVSSGSVDVTLDGESFTVKAPMFDHTFRYDEIEEIRFIEDFDKGSRRMGYNDSHISSGKYRNDLFGDYQLAAYNAVTPCVAISVGGEMYAFNQDSDAKTLELYKSIENRLPVSQLIIN